MPYSDSQYLDPLLIVWRKGTVEDPYIDKAEYLKAVNQTIILSEIPDKFTRVKITGLVEVNEDFITNRSLAENQYSVNYATGIIQVHASKEAETFNIFYKGRGFIQYPSNRIYHQDKFNNVVLSLDEIIRNSQEFLDNIDEKISDYQSIKLLMLNKIDEINKATDISTKATEKSELATEKALDAYDTTRLVFKPYVNTFSQIAFQYPNPQVGWTTQVYNTGVRYRYDGISWVGVDLFGGNLPDASSTTRGLMSIATYNQLQKVAKDVLDLENKPKGKTIVFCFPYLNGGANSIVARFPYVGTIKSIKGICSKAGSDVETEIDIEKSTNMVTWTSIFSNSFLTFNLNSHFDANNHTLLGRGVAVGDLFRVNVRTLSAEIEGVTIEIEIEV